MTDIQDEHESFENNVDPAAPLAVYTPAAKQTDESKPATKHAGLAIALTNIGILLLAPVTAIFLLVFVFQSYRVDGQSMQTTLNNDDRLIVWKLPRTVAQVTGNQYVPNRGDVIILKESGLSTYGDSTDEKQLVKRVIGLPGDHVVIKNGQVKIYNDEHPNGFNPDAALPYGKTTDLSFTPTDVDFKLTDSQIFVCGDNRTNSLDSRTFGPIETKQIVGKLIARIWPLSKAEKF